MEKVHDLFAPCWESSTLRVTSSRAGTPTSSPHLIVVTRDDEEQARRGERPTGGGGSDPAATGREERGQVP